MTPLREAMIKAMQMRGFSERTHHSYLMAVTDLAHWTEHSPAELSPVQVNGYFEHLVIERGLAKAKGPRTARCRCRRPCWNSCVSIGLHPTTRAQPLGRGP